MNPTALEFKKEKLQIKIHNSLPLTKLTLSAYQISLLHTTRNWSRHNLSMLQKTGVRGMKENQCTVKSPRKRYYNFFLMRNNSFAESSTKL